MFHIIVNPTSGKNKGKKALAKVEKVFAEKNIEYAIHATAYEKHATEIAAELTKEGNVDLLVLGGDGTFNEVLNGMENFDNVRVGLIPCGTGNDFVRAAKIPTDTLAALQFVLDGNTESVDFIQLDDRRALNCAGAGMDVDTLVKYAEMKHFHGKIKYYIALFSVLARLHFHRMRITSDEETLETGVFMAAATNGTCIGGGMPLSPLSDVSDNFLNVVVIEELPKRKVFGMLLKFLKGKHIHMPCVKHFLTKKVTLEILDEGKTEVDGQVYENKVLHCTLVPDKLKVFLPPKVNG